MAPTAPTKLSRRLVVITGLSAVAFVGPLLDLYGKNPEVFVANRTSAVEIFLFAFAVALVIPLISWGVLAIAAAIGGRAPDLAYQVLVGILTVATGFVVSRQVFPDSTVGAVLLARGGGRRSSSGWSGVWMSCSSWLRWRIPVLVVMFLGTSATARLIWSEPETVEGTTSIASPHHVVMLQLDEMPLASIMDLDGTVNERLFPNFNRLAEEGTWYRNALSDSIATTQSVPAILSGVKGETGQSPSFVDHPDNLFTLIGDEYDDARHRVGRRDVPRGDMPRLRRQGPGAILQPA